MTARLDRRPTRDCEEVDTLGLDLYSVQCILECVCMLKASILMFKSSQIQLAKRSFRAQCRRADPQPIYVKTNIERTKSSAPCSVDILQSLLQHHLPDMESRSQPTQLEEPAPDTIVTALGMLSGTPMWFLRLCTHNSCSLRSCVHTVQELLNCSQRCEFYDTEHISSGDLFQTSQEKTSRRGPEVSRFLTKFHMLK